MSIGSNPFEEIERLFERMSRQFEDATRKWERDDSMSLWPSEFKTMAIDLVDHDDDLVMTVDLPGFEPEEVDIRITDHTLKIDADYEESTEEDEESYLRRERHHKSLHRSIRLPAEIDSEGVEASMNNGILTVVLPKLEDAEAKKIDIE